MIALSGMSVLDNSADLANAGTAWVMLKPFSERLKAKDQDLAVDLRGLEKVMAALPDGQAYVLPPPAIQGIGNAGGFQMQLETARRLDRLPEAWQSDATRSWARRTRILPCATWSPPSALRRRTSR